MRGTENFIPADIQCPRNEKAQANETGMRHARVAAPQPGAPAQTKAHIITTIQTTPEIALRVLLPMVRTLQIPYCRALSSNLVKRDIRSRINSRLTAMIHTGTAFR
jgi:hypothetical protein